jgi:hypothetical protein
MHVYIFDQFNLLDLLHKYVYNAFTVYRGVIYEVKFMSVPELLPTVLNTI